MPPKRQISEEMILEQAFVMTRKQGFEHLTARALAGELHCSTQPIYQAFGGMEGLKTAVIRKAIGMMMWYVLEHKEDALPDEVSWLLGYVQFADREKMLFQLIFTAGMRELSQVVGANRQIRFDPDLLIYANGMILMTAFQSIQPSPTERRAMLLHAYEAFRGIRIS